MEWTETVENERIAQVVRQVLRQQDKRRRNDQGNGGELLGGAMARFLDECGCSVSELARQTGQHPSYYARIIKGQRGMSLETLARIYWTSIGMGCIHAGNSFVFAVLSAVDPLGKTWDS